MSTRVRSVVTNVIANMSETLKIGRQRWQECGIGRIETLCLLALSIGLLIGAGGFSSGRPVVDCLWRSVFYVRG